MTNMDYGEAESYLLEIPRFTRKNAPEDTAAFLRRLGEPGKEKTIIHIAGTNGKGSVCAYLSSVLQKGGYRVGMFTSPHLVTMRERFRINGELMPEADFVRYLESICSLLRDRKGSGAYHPTFFEMLFFMGMLYFEEQNAEVILLETGLGGRLDATNSVSQKDLCIITRIGMDHMEYLGWSVSEIAGEKAGILQEGVPVVAADSGKESSFVIAERAQELSCPLFFVSKRDIRNLEFHKNFIDFSFDSRYYGYIRYSLTTFASYQVENAALALRALDVLADRLPVSVEALTRGMRDARWEGRMEEIRPGIYLDGAHNVDGIRAFLDAAGRDGSVGRRFLLFSAVQDKQFPEMARMLTDSGLFDRIFVTEIQNARSLSRQCLEEVFHATGVEQIEGFANSQNAWKVLLREKLSDDRVYIAGSLYLAGEIKGCLMRKEYD